MDALFLALSKTPSPQQAVRPPQQRAGPLPHFQLQLQPFPPHGACRLPDGVLAEQGVGGGPEAESQKENTVFVLTHHLPVG